jgi:hypothetical protein
MAELIFSFTGLNLGMRQEKGRTGKNNGSKPQCAIVRLVFGLGSWTELVGSLWSDEPIGAWLGMMVTMERSVSVNPSCVDTKPTMLIAKVNSVLRSHHPTISCRH